MLAAAATTVAAMVAIASGVVELRKGVQAPPDTVGLAVTLRELQDQGGDGRVWTVVHYVMTHSGGPREVSLAYAWFAAGTLRRIQPEDWVVGEALIVPEGNGQLAGDIEVDYPLLPSWLHDTECLFVRVAVLARDGVELGYADTAPVDPYDTIDQPCLGPEPTAAVSN